MPTAVYGADRPALKTQDGAVWTYGELRARANQIARVLTEDLGLVTGNRVLLRAPNNPWTVAAWLGVIKAGGIVVTTMAALRARELAPIVAKTRPSIALVDHRHADDVRLVADSTAPGLRIVAYGGDAADDLTRLIRSKAGDFAAADTAADDVALFGPTSGSTGVPKITTHFHRDLLSIDNTFGKMTLRLRPDGPGRLHGTVRVHVRPRDAGRVHAPRGRVRFPHRDGHAGPARRHGRRAPESRCSPPRPRPTGRSCGTAGAGSSGLRTAVSAGEHIPRETWQRLRDDVGLRVIDGIGATEMLHIFISAADDDIRPGATGKPVPGYRAAILDADGNEAGPGVAGRLAVIGPVGCRYLDDERQSGYVVNGWNVTGDTFVKDDDGYFWYQGRTDNMIVSSGYNIGGPEVESAIDTHPDVVESAVIAKPGPGARHRRLRVRRAPRRRGRGRRQGQGDPGLRQEASWHRTSTRGTSASPTSLPRNASGKVQHFKLRKAIAAEADARQKAATTEAGA